MAQRLTPNSLALVERFNGDPKALGEHLQRENRNHAVGHGYERPMLAAYQMVAAVRDGSPEEIERCRKVNREHDEYLGISGSLSYGR